MAVTPLAQACWRALARGVAVLGTTASGIATPRKATRFACAGFAVLALAGCAQLRTPRPLPPPGEVTGGSPIPGRGAILAAAQAFQNQGAGLSGHPAETAIAAAQIEYLAEDIPHDPHFTPMPADVGIELQIARREVRAALGIPDQAPSHAVMMALVDAARDLRAGKREAAIHALRPGLFSPAGADALAHLNEPGPFPQTGNATALAADAVGKLDAEARWSGRAVSEEIPQAQGSITSGLGESTAGTLRY